MLPDFVPPLKVPDGRLPPQHHLVHCHGVILRVKDNLPPGDYLIVAVPKWIHLHGVNTTQNVAVVNRIFCQQVSCQPPRTPSGVYLF